MTPTHTAVNLSTGARVATHHAHALALVAYWAGKGERCRLEVRGGVEPAALRAQADLLDADHQGTAHTAGAADLLRAAATTIEGYTHE